MKREEEKRWFGMKMEERERERGDLYKYEEEVGTKSSYSLVNDV